MASHTGADASNIVDQVGLFSTTDPGVAWPVCGTNSGMDTRNGRLIRSPTTHCGDATGAAFDGTAMGVAQCPWTESPQQSLSVAAWSPPATAMFQVTSGTDYCTVTHGGTCVTDGVGNHGNAERCTVTALATQGLYASTTFFNTETYWDYITLGGQRYSGSNGFANVMMAAQETFTWYTDGSVTTGGFEVCGSFTVAPPSPPPSPLAPVPAGQMWLVTSTTGSASDPDCYLTANAAGVAGACVTDGPGVHGNAERCTFQALADLYAQGTYFTTESNYDYIQIGRRRFSGTNAPANVQMTRLQTMSWYTDGSVIRGGFTICATTSRLLFPPPPPPSPSPPPPIYSPAPPQASNYTWIVLSGSAYCQPTSAAGFAMGDCVTDGFGNHGNGERCTIAVRNAMYVTATYFNTEANYDWVTIGSQRWSGTTGPTNVEMNAGDVMSWSSDGSVVRGGWIICGSTTPMAIPPPPPPVPSPPPPTPFPPMSACANPSYHACSGPHGSICLRAIEPSECPTDPGPHTVPPGGTWSQVPQCHLGVVPVEGLCEADSECGTQNLNNCNPGGWDVYEVMSYSPHPPAMPSPPLPAAAAALPALPRPRRRRRHRRRRARP